MVEEEIKDKVNRMLGTEQAKLSEIQIVDDMDEDLIIKEKVEGTDALVYKIKDKYYLSIQGVMYAALRRGNIHIVTVDIRKFGDKEVGYCEAMDLKRNVKIAAIAERYTNEQYKVTTLINNFKKQEKKREYDHFAEKIVEHFHKDVKERNLAINLETYVEIRKLRELMTIRKLLGKLIDTIEETDSYSSLRKRVKSLEGQMKAVRQIVLALAEKEAHG